MATAIKELKVIQPLIQEEMIVLTLTKFEAQALLSVANRIGGRGKARHVFSDTERSINTVLRRQGICEDEDTIKVHPDMDVIAFL